MNITSLKILQNMDSNGKTVEQYQQWLSLNTYISCSELIEHQHEGASYTFESLSFSFFPLPSPPVDLNSVVSKPRYLI